MILLFCLYNVVCILFLSPYSGKKLLSRVSRAVNAVKSNIKHAGPKRTENIIYKSNIVNKTNDSPWANQIKRTTVFSGPTQIREENTEEVIIQYEEVEDPDNTEIIFKGVAEELAFIKIRKKINGQWYEQGFSARIGEIIGKEQVVGGEILDFTTNYVLQDIVYNAQRPITLSKKVVDLDDAGAFVGTRMVPGETYMKTTSKIKYKDENGNMNELWLNESAGMVRAEEEKLSENVEITAKPAVSKESAAIKNLTKQQQEIANKAKKPFEKNVEMLRSILEEAESGY